MASAQKGGLKLGHRIMEKVKGDSEIDINISAWASCEGQTHSSGWIGRRGGSQVPHTYLMTESRSWFCLETAYTIYGQVSGGWLVPSE